MAIILQGMCYSGKTTLGKLVADKLGVPFVDSRDLFRNTHGMSECDYLRLNGRDLLERDVSQIHYLQHYDPLDWSNTLPFRALMD